MRNSSNRPGCTRRSSIAFPVSIELKIHDPLTQIFCVVSLKYNSKEHLKLFEQNKWKEKAQANKDPNHPRPVSRLLCETFKIKTLMECYNKFKFIHLKKKKKKKVQIYYIPSTPTQPGCSPKFVMACVIYQCRHCDQSISLYEILSTLLPNKFQSIPFD
jgi:hypothetical protein